MARFEPADMTEVTIVGPNDRLEDVLDILQQEKLIQFKDNDTEWGTGEPLEEAERTSRLLLEIENLLSKMENIPENVNQKVKPSSDIENQLEKLKEEYETIETRKEGIKEEIDQTKEKISFLERFQNNNLSAKDLEDTETVNVRHTSDEIPDKVRNSDKVEVLDGTEGSLVFFRSKAKEILESEGINLEKPPKFERQGDLTKLLSLLRGSLDHLEEEYQEVKEKIENFEKREGPVLLEIKRKLQLELEKAEAPLNFGFREKSFVAKGYIPSNKVQEAEKVLEKATDGAVAIETEDPQNPPTKLEHSEKVQPFESLVNLVGTPKHNEVDPTNLLFLVFPVFFGFMVGDIIHGLLMAGIFYGGMKMRPDLDDIFNTLLWCSGFTIFFGLIYGQALGYQIFGAESVLAGYLPIIQEIPVLFDRELAWDQVFYLSALIGFAHVNLGILLGAYNRYIQNSLKDAILDKLSWLVLQAGAILMYLHSLTVGSLIAVLGLVMLAKGQGLQGIIMIPNLLGFMLSYLRLFGVALGGAVIATLVNGTAAGLIATGTIWGMVLAVTIFVFGHAFLTGLKILQGGLQGIRLQYVEFFNYFYEGRGKKFIPFGKKYSR